MLKETKDKSKIAIVLLHEIYGINNHIISIKNEFENEGYDTYCVDLLNDKTFDYEEADEAYSYFMNTIGFKKAKLKVLDYLYTIRKHYERIYLIGYSIGATVAWLCSEEKGLLDGVVCYYGSRIRDYISIEPKVETVLFFPYKENGFNIETVIEKLKDKEKVIIYKFNGLHGFSDPFSKYYNCKGKELSEDIIKELIFK